MISTSTRIIAIFTFGAAFFISIGGELVHSQSVREYQKQVLVTLDLAKTFHQRSDTIGQGGDRIAKKKNFYVSMARNLKPATEAAHLPFPNDSSEAWISRAKTVASGLKVNTNYQVVKSQEDAVICVDEEIAKNLYSNVRFIAWYRDQLAEQTKSDEGTEELAKLIDAFIESIDSGIPRVKKVKMTGTLNVPRQQLINISKDDVWGILSTINRFFFYKSQVDRAPEKNKADFLLVDAMTKTAAIYGVPPDGNSLIKIDVELAPTSKGWRSDAYKALDSWNEVLNQPAPTTTSILIPAKPAKKSANASTKANKGFPDDVEDVKEIAGEIFIKQQGRWKIWKKK